LYLYVLFPLSVAHSVLHLVKGSKRI
jgi:hypothetical protein